MKLRIQGPARLVLLLLACSGGQIAAQSGVGTAPLGGRGGGGPAPLDNLAQEPRRNPSVGIDPADNPGGLLLHSGELLLARTDLAIRGREMGFAFTRTYRSGGDEDGPLGFGWDANVFRRLEELPGGDVRAHDGAGRRDRYQSLGGGDYASPRGFYTKLKKHGSGFDLRERDGTTCSFDLAGRLVRVEDMIGNAHDYSYGVGGGLETVEDEFGREVQLAYDGAGRLETVTDFSGREVRFTYDGAGNLVEARSPLVVGTPHGNDFPSGKRERYAYLGGSNPTLAHNLTEVIRPNEVEDGSLAPSLVNTYGTRGRKLDRVLKQVVGGTNASGVPSGGFLRFAYTFGPSGGPAGTASRTRVTDRRGNVADYYHDARGHAISVVENPAGPTPFVSTFEFNAEGELTRALRPLGNETLFLYDKASPDRFQQGNLLELRRLPDGRGAAQAELLTTFAYEPLFNQVRTETGPRGNDAGYVPPNGGPTSPARYTRTTTFDYQEAASAPAEAADWGITVPAALLGLGDVNGDGRTDQAMGNRVRTEGPTVTLLAGSEQAAVEGDTSQEIVSDYVYDDFGQLVELEGPRGNVDTFAYYPENDPDGDGLDLIAGRDPTTGGHLSGWTEDALVGPRREDTAPPAAIVRAFEYDDRGNATVRTDGRGFDSLATYNSLDQVVQEEDPKVDPGMATGYRRRLVYDANDNVLERHVENWKADPSGAQVLDGAHPWFVHRTTYDILDDRVEEMRDATRDPLVPASAEPETLTTRYRYDANRNLVRVESPEAVAGTQPGNVVTYGYDERDLRTSMTRGTGSPEESTWTFSYDENANRTGWTDAVDDDLVAGPETESYVYDGYDRLVRVVDRAGNERDYAYDPDSRMVATEARGPVDGSAGPPVLLEHTDFLADELGRTYQVDRDLFLPAGVSTTHPIVLADGPLTPGDGKVSLRLEYDANSRQTFRVEDDGDVRSREYDGADRRIRTAVPLFDGPTQNATVFDYDGNDNVVRVEETHVSPEGHVPPAVLETHYVYDALNRLVRTTDNLGSTSYLDYDSRGNAVGVFDARGALIADPSGLFAGMINDRGNPVRHAYDGTDRHWLTTLELHVDGQGNLALDTSNPAIPSGLIDLLIEYDANDRVVRRTDGNGNTTSYAYDSLDRLVWQTNADGGSRTVVHDADDHRTSGTDENGSVHTFTYDALDRLVRHDIAPNTSIEIRTGIPMLAGTTVRTFEYDGLSRLTRSEDENEPADGGDDWAVVSRYDSLSRMVEQDQDGRAVASSFEAEMRTELFYPAPGSGRVVHFVRDGADQIVEISNHSAVTVATNYVGDCCPPVFQEFTSFDPAPQLALTVVQGLDGVKQLAQSTATTPAAGTIGQQSVLRNRNHEVEELDLLLQNGANFIDVQFDWELSSLSQILVHDRFQNVNGTPAATHLEYQLGPAQEILTVTDGVIPVRSNSFDPTYERTNAPFVYDAGEPSGTGIRTEDQDFLYQWDGLGRLSAVYDAVSPHDPIATYDYDAEPAIAGGRRVEKEVTNSGSLDGITRFYYDEDEVIEETTVAGMSEEIKAQYLYNYRWTDDVVAMDLDTDADGDPDALFFYVKDVNNNVTHLVDEAGLPVELYTYDMLAATQIFDPSMSPLALSAVGNPYLFTGRRWEPEIGLYEYRARYYDPVEGEFLNRDPIGFWGDASNHGNPMAYTGNDPWNRRDPTGMEDGKKITVAPVISVPSGQDPDDFKSSLYKFRAPIGNALGGDFDEEGFNVKEADCEVPATNQDADQQLNFVLDSLNRGEIGVLIAHGLGGNRVSLPSGAATADDIKASEGSLSNVQVLFVTSCRGGGNAAVGQALADKGAKIVITSTELVKDELMAEFSGHFLAELNNGTPPNKALTNAQDATKKDKKPGQKTMIDGFRINTGKGVDANKPFKLGKPGKK